MTRKRMKIIMELNKIKCMKRKKCKINSGLNFIRRDLEENCTIHGLSYIFNPRLHFVERIFWLISFVGSVSVIIHLLAAQYIRFIQSPTVMSVEMNYFDWNISYPAITLCPLHKVNTSLYNQILDKVFRGYDPVKAGAFLFNIGTAHMDNIDFLYLDVPENISSVIHPNAYSKLAAEIFFTVGDDSLTTNKEWDIKLETAMTEIGMCHVINSNVAVYDNPLSWHEELFGYARTNIELTIYEGDFIAQITNYSAHYKVYIHHPDEMILSTSKTSPSSTFNIEGYIALGLSVLSTRISDEIRPWSISLRKCRFVNETSSKRYPVYSYNHCILECRIGVILQLCKCLPHFYKPLPNERVCSINELKCIRKYKKEILSLKIPKNLIKKYRYSKKLPKSPKDCGCLNNCETDVYSKDNEIFTSEKSMSMLQVGITSFPKMRIVREIIFHTNDMLLRSFGVINLFIGSSILSFIELAVIVAKLLYYLVCKYCVKYKNSI